MAPGMGMVFLINGRAYEHDRIDTRVKIGDTEDWDLVNAGVMDHPFHVHVNPFQVISRNGRPEPFRAWRDVVLVRREKRCGSAPASTTFPVARCTTATSSITRNWA